MQVPVLLTEDDPARDEPPTRIPRRTPSHPWLRTASRHHPDLHDTDVPIATRALVSHQCGEAHARRPRPRGGHGVGCALLWPSYTPTPQDAGTTTAPAPSPSASPTRPQSAPSVPSPVGLAPAGLPPPTPPPAEPPPPASPPHYYPRYTEPSKQKPRVDVTRTPISAAPTVRQQPRADSSAPGDGPKRGWPW